MIAQDISQNPRIASLTKLTRKLQQSRTPEQTNRIKRVFRDAGDQPAELIERLREAVRDHEQGQSPSDDQTLVAARVL